MWKVKQVILVKIDSIEKEIIVLLETNKLQPNKLSRYSWLKAFNEINVDSILNTISPTFPPNLF